MQSDMFFCIFFVRLQWMTDGNIQTVCEKRGGGSEEPLIVAGSVYCNKLCLMVAFVLAFAYLGVFKISCLTENIPIKLNNKEEQIKQQIKH